MSSLTDALRRSIEFISWANYADTRVWALWLWSLAMLALFVTVAWNAGSIVMRGWRHASAAEEMVLSVGSGLAMMSAALFVLGVLDLFRWPIVAVLAIAALVAPAVRDRDPRLVLRPLARLAAVVREAPLVVAVLLVLSIGALLPPYRWDETGYHLAYVDQWLQAGGLTVNPTMRYPLYTFNWHVLQGVALMLRSESLVHLLSWLAALLGALAVMRLALRMGVGAPLATIAAIAFSVTPVVQRYAVLGMTDVPLMALLAIAVLALLAAADQEEGRVQTALPAALAAAMFVGMKITGMLFVPLFLALGVLRFRAAARTAFVVVFCAVGVLWYARNLVLIGDPAPPVVSEALGRPTPWWSESDLRLQAEDLARGLDRDAASLLSLPVRMLRSTESGTLRDWPALGYMLLFPLTLLLAPALRRRRQLEPLVVAWYAVAAWIATAYLIRYAVFLPLAAALAAVVVDRVSKAGLARQYRRQPLVAALLGVVFLIGPTNAAVSYGKTSLSQRVPVDGPARRAFVEHRMPEAVAIRAAEAAIVPPARIYTIDSQLRYHFQRAGYDVVGDDFHDGRFRDFRTAVLEGRTTDFLAAQDAQYLVLTGVHAESRLGLTLDSLRTMLAAAPPLRQLAVDSTVAIYAPLELAAGERTP